VNRESAPVAETGARASGWRLRWRRFAVWFNPTLIQQALWPVLALVVGFALHDDANAPWDEWAGNVASLLLAIGIALLAVRRLGERPAFPSVPGLVAGNARIIAVGLPLMVFAARLIGGETTRVFRLAVVGLLGAIAFQLIHFWCARSVYPRLPIVILLFGVSWGIHQIAWTLARDAGGSLILSGLGGLTAGALVGLASAGLYRWPGGRYTAAGVQWLVITLILGFTN
jgi:hypothetical protein